MYTVLAGGVGASRFLQGLVQVVDPAAVTVISNTGDDVEMFGLYVAPDVDIVTYALAGAVNPETGWGLEGDTLHVVEALQRYGYPGWFNLGDRDLATAIHRTRLFREGHAYHEICADIAEAWGVRTRVLPMSDERVVTRIFGTDGEVPFQEYMVRLRGEPEVTRVEFGGIDGAKPAPGVLEAIREASVLIIAPSNPFVSVGPILAVPGVREAVESTRATRVAVTPIIAGDVVKGPAARMMRSLRHEVSAVGVAAIYRGLIDVFVLDEQDRDLAPRIEALGMRCAVEDTMLTSDQRKAEVAAGVLAAGGNSPLSIDVLVPVARLAGAKQRLSGVLTVDQRAELTLATLIQVVEAVHQAGGRPIVLSSDDRVLTSAGAYATMKEAPGAGGLSAAIEEAVGRLAVPEVAVLHADLPLATHEDVAKLLEEAAPAPSVTMVESRDGGTNAMFLRPPGRFPLQYGKESARLHREAAEQAGMTVKTIDIPGLQLDLDTPDDLRRLLSLKHGRTSEAGKLLRSWGFEEAPLAD